MKSNPVTTACSSIRTFCCAGVFTRLLGAAGVVTVMTCSVLMGAVAASAAEPWNPVPEDDDVVFSLPCDMKIAFRKITTQELSAGENSILDDRRVRLGSTEAQRAYLNYLRTEFIAGHFFKDNTRFYLLGKYEVTVGQVKSLSGDPACSMTDEDREMPVQRASWYDAVDFGRRLTGHLLKEDGPKLQEALGTKAIYARLPTEIEWEFAARGGLSVSPADFQGERFPMPEDLKTYAWFNDPLSSQGELSPIGLLKPNPLGLYDVYGNVAEMMMEPFTLNKAGRRHGLAGGVLLKGGSFQSNSAYVNSPGREEDAVFDSETGSERKLRTTGFRLALVGLALPGNDAVERLSREWELASASTLPANDNPMTLIESLKQTSSDLQLSSSLASIEQAIRTELAASADRRKLLLRGILINAGKTVSDIRIRYRSFANRQLLLQQGGVLSDQDVAALRGQLAEDESYIQELNYFNRDILVNMIENYEMGDLDNQAQIVAAELRQRNLENVAEGVGIAAAIAREINENNQGYQREDVLRLTLGGL